MQLPRVHSPERSSSSEFLRRSVPRPLSWTRLCLGFGPSSRHHRGVSTRHKGCQAFVTFRPQVFSTSRRFTPPPSSAGLFHPAAASRAFLSRGFSLRTADFLVESHPALMPLAHRALGNRSCRPCSACLDFEALIRVEQRIPNSSYSPLSRLAPLVRF